MQTIKARPGIGWVRANIATNTESLQELNDLRKEVEQLRAYKSKKEEDNFGYIANIADWDEAFALRLNKPYNPYDNRIDIEFPEYIEKTWEEWFKLIITEMQTDKFLIIESVEDVISRVITSFGEKYRGYAPSSQDVLTMGYQFTSYGVIDVRNDYDGNNWTLTAKGKKLYAQMMCIKTNKVK